jgi:hypothetical protein
MAKESAQEQAIDFSDLEAEVNDLARMARLAELQVNPGKPPA